MKSVRALLAVATFALPLLGSSAAAQQADESAEVETLRADADRLYRAGRIDEAIALSERVLSIQEKALGPDSPGVVDAINDLAMLYLTADDYEAAQALFERVLEITTNTLGSQDPAVATTLNNLGMVYWEWGDRESAERYLEKAIAVWEGSLGPDHPKVAVALNNMASLYRKAGDLARAEPLYEKALGIWEKSADPSHEQHADILRNLAAISQQKGDNEKTESYLKRALTLEEGVRGANESEIAVALSNLALYYYNAGDYARAKPLLERALAILQEARSPEHAEVISASNNLAAAYAALGDTANAARLYERVIEIRSKTQDSEPLPLAAALEELAALYRDHREYARSRPLYERALKICVENLGPDNLRVAKITKDVATVQWALGDFAGAKARFERVLSIREKNRNPENSVVALSIDNLASADLVLGDHASAKSRYEKALAIREASFEPEHPSITHSLRNLGLLHWAQADWEQAETYFSRAAELEQRQISLLVPVQPSDRARAFMDELSNTANAILSFQRRRPDPQSTTRLALTTVLRRKGRELDIGVDESAAVRRRLGGEERALFDKILAQRDRLGRLILQRSNRTRSKSYAEGVAKLRSELDDLEKAAASGSVALRSWVTPVEIDDLQSKIPANAALIELVEYQDFDPSRIVTDRIGDPVRVAAFVLRAAGDPQWIPLGEAAAIDASAHAFRQVLVDADSPATQVTERARDLYDRVAAPIESYLKGIQTLFVAPDPEMVLVPLGAMIDPDGRHWVERYEIAYLTSGRDLMLPHPVLPSGGSPLVVASPDYNAKRPAKREAIGEARAQFSPGVAALRFPPIAFSQPGGALEVGKLLGVATLTGERATDAAVLAARAPHILHIAADGFFLPDPARESSARWGSILSVDTRLLRPEIENPLLRSGLAFSGANRRADDTDGGLLTAWDIAELDLSGTELAAISVRGIESKRAAIDRAVYAFRRAFVMAGAETQFANLWTTEHRVAAELTTAYYERLLAGEGRSEALRSIQLEMLRSEGRGHPFYWASFVSIGARGPISWPASPQTAQRSSGTR